VQNRDSSEARNGIVFATAPARVQERAAPMPGVSGRIAVREPLRRGSCTATQMR